ncbi:MAG: enoyl-CoA hydratase [Sphingopyxis sp.]|nr:MAG: enoyl-CoA hydratase [Sphingopyxis sp.]
MFETITFEVPVERVARISLNRPEARNAQNTKLLYELNDAFDKAAADDDISVIILAANGPHFSAGHDLREPDPIGSLKDYDTVGTWCGFSCDGAEGWMAREKELYQGLSERWRNIPKPTIAQVQGKCIAGGLMLVWPCDLIVASEDASFSDNTVSMGMTGVEFFGHPWELGARKAKEMLFTSDSVSAQDAHRLGMVNQVVTAADLESSTLDLASRIAAKPLFALKLAKESVNAAADAQGRVSAMQTAFALHQLGHSHNMQVHGLPIDPRGAGGLVEAPKK